MLKGLFSKGLFFCTLLCALFTISACAPKPVKMIFAPPSEQGQSNLYRGENYQITVNDYRAEKHLLKVIRGDDTEHHQPGSPIIQNLTKSLKQSFKHQGITVNDYAGDQIIVDIIQLETVVEQTLVDYQASMSVELKVTIKNGNKRTYKHFTGHSERSNYLKYDLALLERDLNALIERVLADMYADSYIQQSIQA